MTDGSSIATDKASAAEVQHRMVMAGILFGIGAAIFYTLANTSMRQISTRVDYVLATALRAAFTLTGALCFFAVEQFRIRTGRSLHAAPWLPLRPLLLLIGSAIIVQIFGGMMMQRAFGTIGIALVVPIYIGAMVTASAIFGSLWLNESVSAKLAMALLVLVVSVFVLSLGADRANAAMQTPDNIVMGGVSFVDGLLSATLVGITYALLGTTIRYVLVQHPISEFLPVIIVSTCGVLILGGASLAGGGWDQMQNLTGAQWGWLMTAGACNSIGFSCLSKSLKRLPVAYVNAINASQAALAALVGITWFAELLTASLIVGVAIMLAGFWMLSRR